MSASLRLSVGPWGGALPDNPRPGTHHSVQNARQTWSERRGQLVVLQSAEGQAGYGEATPLAGYVNEAPFTDWGDLPWQECVRLARARKALALPAHLPPSARFAMETSVLDLVARETGQPLLKPLLGQTEQATANLFESALCGPVLSETAGHRAERLVRVGYRSLKFKVTGTSPSAEARWLRELRRRLSAPVKIRLDLNGGLDVTAARAALNEYRAADVAFCEEPTAGAGLLELGPCAVPWFADESLTDEALAADLIDRSACSGIVLKPTVLGGAARCKELAERALRRGLDAVVTHCFEGPVALAAARALAKALGSGRAADGLAPHDALSVFFETSPADTGLGLNVQLPGDWKCQQWTL